MGNQQHSRTEMHQGRLTTSAMRFATEKMCSLATDSYDFDEMEGGIIL